MSISNKTILITGCSSGIGLSAAQILQKRGYKVFAGVRKEADKITLAQQDLHTLLLDLNDSDSISHAVNTLLAETEGRLDALVNNAGFGQVGAVEDLTRGSLRNQFETNVFGPQELTNLLIPVMRKQGHGRIINISSVLGLVPMAYRGAYCASKFALEAMTDVMRLELHGTGIYVSLIEPGPIVSRFRDTARSHYAQNIDSLKSVHKPHYSKLLNHFEEFKNNSRLTLGPEAVVKKIIHALESPKPKIHYYVTLPTYFLTSFKRLLPSCLLDAILLQVAKSEAKSNF